MTNQPRSFLVVASSRVGELVMAQSLFIELKNLDPACRIDVLVDSDLFSLLERMPQVAKAVPLPDDFERFRFSDRLRLGSEIRSAGYSHAIVLADGWRYALIPVLARIPVRTGYSPKALLNDCRIADNRWTTLQKFVALGLESSANLYPEHSFPDLDVSLHSKIQVVEKFSIIESSELVLALCPGGGKALDQQWSPEYYTHVADDIVNRGWNVWLLGEEKDHQLGEQICGIADRCKNFIGRTSLAETTDLLSLVDVVVTNHSGLMHIALALHRQVLIVADSTHIDTTACGQPGARLLPLDVTPDLVLSELRGW